MGEVFPHRTGGRGQCVVYFIWVKMQCGGTLSKVIVLRPKQVPKVSAFDWFADFVRVLLWLRCVSTWTVRSIIEWPSAGAPSLSPLSPAREFSSGTLGGRVCRSLWWVRIICCVSLNLTHISLLSMSVSSELMSDPLLVAETKRGVWKVAYFTVETWTQ